MPRCLHIQIQGLRSKGAVEHIDVLLHALCAQAGTEPTKISVEIGAADEYCNVFVEAKKVAGLWKRLTVFVAENSQEFDWMKKRWIVVLQGKSGWSDYLMLDHFDSSVRLDMIKP